MKIQEILKLKSNASEDEIRREYRKAIFKSHPSKGGDEKEFIRVNEAYIRYKKGEDVLNCYAIVSKDFKDFECRCGSIYSIEKEGIIDCVCCSCYIEIE